MKVTGRATTRVPNATPTSSDAATPPSEGTAPMRAAPSAFVDGAGRMRASPTAGAPAATVVQARASVARERRFVERHAQRHELHLDDLAARLKSGALGGIAAARESTAHADTVLAAVDAFVVEDLGAPPTAYALVATGSYGRGELSPYSDLDYGILLSTDGPDVRSYFDRYAHRVGALLTAIAGEGLAPCREMSPTGTMKDAFVGTPEDLARRAAGATADMQVRAPREREFISTGLASGRLAVARGEGVAVHARYAAALRAELGPTSPHVVAGGPRAALVAGLLDGMRDPFGVPERKAGWLGDVDSARPVLKQHAPLPPREAIAQGKVNVKHDLLRAIQLPVQALRALFIEEHDDVATASTDGVLAALAARGLVDAALAEKVRGALDACLRMRAMNQLDLRAPVDAMRALTDEDRRALRRMIPVLFRLRQGMKAAKRDHNAFRLA